MGATRYTRGTRSKGFRSNLERYVAAILKKSGIQFDYEPYNLKYEQPSVVKKYLPDFAKDNVVLEVKGRFTSDDRKKMLLLTQQHPDKVFIMVFGRADNKLSKKSNTTYAMWCDNNNIPWIDLTDFEENPEKCLLSITKKLTLGKPKTSRTMKNKP